MKYCWRCRQQVPMFDEVEFAELSELYGTCIRAVKKRRRIFGVPLGRVQGVHERFEPVRRRHEELTGISMHHNAIMHHDLARLGPDCPSCSKPLRTPRASLCPQCGWTKDQGAVTPLTI